MNGKIESCLDNVIHIEQVNIAKAALPPNDHLNLVVELFKTLGDLTRLKIINALFTTELCVCDISSVLDMNQSAVSHQLRLLKDKRIVKNRKVGKVVYYSLIDEHIFEIFNIGYTHIKE